MLCLNIIFKNRYLFIYQLILVNKMRFSKIPAKQCYMYSHERCGNPYFGLFTFRSLKRHARHKSMFFCVCSTSTYKTPWSLSYSLVFTPFQANRLSSGPRVECFHCKTKSLLFCKLQSPFSADPGCGLSLCAAPCV